jgi:hypothetical protein
VKPPEGCIPKRIQVNVIPKFKIASTIWTGTMKEWAIKSKSKEIVLNYSILEDKFCQKVDLETEKSK